MPLLTSVLRKCAELSTKNPISALNELTQCFSTKPPKYSDIESSADSSDFSVLVEVEFRAEGIPRLPHNFLLF
jgi:hypothetical protein